MAVAALAFGAGLFVQAGIGLVSSLIAGIALFLVMVASHAAFMRTQEQGDVDQRLTTLESAIDQIAEDMERTGQGSAGKDELNELARRVDQIRQFVDQSEQLGSAAEAAAQVNRLSAETERLDARLEALRNQVKIEAEERYDQLTSEFQVLETLVKQMAERLISESQMLAREIEPPPAPPEPAPENATTEPQIHVDAAEPAVELEDTDMIENVPVLDAEEIEAETIKQIRRSIDSNRTELYLQPIMMLPRRRVRYYEALTRLKNEAGQIMLPQDYIQLAESSGMMPVIDNVMLFRSVQVLRRLEKRSSARGVFCNISVHSLLDPEFFSEFSAFLEQNTELADSMFFEFSQSVIDNCGSAELESLAALNALGFCFSLDRVTNLDVDFQKLHGQGFRTIKISADIFLHGMAEAGARIHPADMTSYLERFGMQLIVEKIEDETSLAAVLDHNVRLGQGYLFSEPRPVRPEVFDRKAGAEAA